ncbi:hypothetical protein Bbelb_434880, partial [Branchiostoma belcheri]
EANVAAAAESPSVRWRREINKVTGKIKHEGRARLHNRAASESSGVLSGKQFLVVLNEDLLDLMARVNTVGAQNGSGGVPLAKCHLFGGPCSTDEVPGRPCPESNFTQRETAARFGDGTSTSHNSLLKENFLSKSISRPPQRDGSGIDRQSLKGTPVNRVTQLRGLSGRVSEGTTGR